MITADINIGRVAVYVNALDETVIASEERPVGQKTDVLDVLKEMIGRVLERAGTVRTILACAISVTGVVNEDKGIVVEAGKLNWYNLDLAGELSYLGVPVLVRNDANMFAYYEKSQFPADLNFMGSPRSTWESAPPLCWVAGCWRAPTTWPESWAT